MHMGYRENIPLLYSWKFSGVRKEVSLAFGMFLLFGKARRKRKRRNTTLLQLSEMGSVWRELCYSTKKASAIVFKSKESSKQPGMNMFVNFVIPYSQSNFGCRMQCCGIHFEELPFLMNDLNWVKSFDYYISNFGFVENFRGPFGKFCEKSVFRTWKATLIKKKLLIKSF